MTTSRTRSIGPARFNTAVQALAGLACNGGTVSSSVIAAQVQSHATFLRRILATLASHGIVDTREGRDGGYSLKISADTLTLADIYQAIRNEEAEQSASDGCMEHSSTEIGGILKNVMMDAERQAIEYLKQYTLSDLLREANQRKLTDIAGLLKN
ncbi:RrF2 family transcriptional regulator [Paenibacillus sp. Z6-24]